MQYGEKIRFIRETRGLSQENLAAQLGIAQNSYSKIERNETKLSTAMLKKIADVLDVSPMDIITSQPAIVNFQPNQGTQQSFGFVENVVLSQKELYEKIIASKDEEIARLAKLVETLAAKR
jgi:transcriptional regulator with XRE-family HTH domain